MNEEIQAANDIEGQNPEPPRADAAPAAQPAAPSPARNGGPLNARALDFLRDIPLEVTVELGRTRMPIGELFSLGPSSIIELDKASDEPLDLRINGVLIARGEAVNVNDRFGIRLTSIVESDKLLDTLKS